MKVNNVSIAQQANQILDLKGENFFEAFDVLQPVIPIIPFLDIVESSSLQDATAATIYTTPTGKDFFLCSAQLSVGKDVNATAVSINLAGTIRGVVKNIITIAATSATAQHINKTISFPYPIKIDRGTAITVTSNTAIASIRVSGNIAGYTQETTKST